MYILNGEYPVATNLTVGYEYVGIIEKLVSEIYGLKVSDRVIADAITQSGYSNACLCDIGAQAGLDPPYGFKVAVGWKFGNTIDGRQAEYLRMLRPGGTLSSLGVYSSDLKLALDAFGASHGDFTIVSTLCPSGKEPMRRPTDVSARPRGLEQASDTTLQAQRNRRCLAYYLFANQRNGMAAAMPFVAYHSTLTVSPAFSSAT